MSMETVEDITAVQALGVALSVAAPVLSMNASQNAAPAMLEHLNRMGYDVVPAERGHCMCCDYAGDGSTPPYGYER